MAATLRARRRVVVVGAGLAGLSAACHLAGSGHEVTVVERDRRPGGRAGRLVRDGFEFDTGPSVLTMPDLLEETFRAAGVEMAGALSLRPLDPAYRACFPDGSTLRLRRGREAMAEEIRTVCGPRDEAAYLRFCDWLERLYRLEMPTFIDRNYDRPWDLLHSSGALARLVGLGAMRRLTRVVDGYFRDPRLRRLFSFQAMYAGLAPQEALAVFAVITYMDSVRGVYFPAGGMAAVPEALAAAAEKAGAQFRYGTGVDQVVHSDQVHGVRMRDGELIGCDAVIVTADLPTAYAELLPSLSAPRAVRRATYSPSALVWHVGVRGRPTADTAHHNIHFGREWGSAFTALLRDGVTMPDPSVLVTVPTLSDPSLAPADSSVLYVLEPVPNLGGRVDWSRHRGPARDRLARLVAGWGYPGDIRVEELVDPTDWQREGMAGGTPFSLAHRFSQSGPFRPANVDRRVRGLVFAGSGTVPGVGVPMVLISGKLAARRVEEM